MNEKRLNFEEFVAKVMESIRDYLPERFADADVKVEHFQKLNASYLGMQVKRADQTVVPNINLNTRFEEYQRTGMSLDDAMRAIAEQVQLAPDLQTAWLKDYSQVQDHLFIRVSDAKESEAFLRMSPHKEVDGLAISYHIAFEGLHGVEASTPVSYKMMEMYGVTAEQLHADALESTQRLYPVKYSSMTEVLQQMMGIEPEMAAEMIPPVEGPQLMVLTNAQSFQGAAAMFYPGQLDAIAEQMGTDFFVLPSSVHEVLILPDDGSQDLDSLQFMVREINASEVAPEDRLSDFVYHYDAQDHVLERAETFTARVAEKAQETERTEHPEDRDSSHDPGREDTSRKERKSVLNRLNEKKEQVKGQPKKSGPNRTQEASI